MDKNAGDAFNIPSKKTQQWSKITQKNVQASQSKYHQENILLMKKNILYNILNISDIRAESQKLRSTVSSVCNQGVTEIKQHWMSSNNVSEIFLKNVKKYFHNSI